MTEMPLTHLSLFTGFGGLDLAAEHAGFDTVGQCEWADYPTRVLEKHWPTMPRWRDIRTLTGESFYERTGLRTVDLISGGFPCQPFSVAGQRKGKDDDRYLWPEMLRVISEIRPTWVVGENVAGLLSMAEPLGRFAVESRTIARLPDSDLYDAVSSRQERMLLHGILEEIRALGYDVQAFCVPACGVGANHQRYRIAIVGHTNSERRKECDTSASNGEAGRTGGGHNSHVSNPGIHRRERKIGNAPAKGCDADEVKDTEPDDEHATDANCEPCESRRPESAGQQREAGVGNGGEDAANPARERCREAGEPCERSEEWTAGGGALSSRRTVHVENANSFECSKQGVLHKQQRGTRTVGTSEGMADADNAGLEIARYEPRLKEVSTSDGTEFRCRRPTQPRMGRRADGIPSGLGGCGRGAEWFESWQQAWMDGSWEAGIPRVAVGWNPKKRADMLRGFGNAVVSQQFYPIMAGIARIEMEAAQ